MKLTGRRTSSNVDDRRGVSGKAVGGGSLLVAAIVGVFTYLQTGSVVSGLSAGWNSYSSQPKVETGSGYTPTKEDEEKYQFAAQILALTDADLSAKLDAFRKEQTQKVLDATI